MNFIFSSMVSALLILSSYSAVAVVKPPTVGQEGLTQRAEGTTKEFCGQVSEVNVVIEQGEMVNDRIVLSRFKGGVLELLRFSYPSLALRVLTEVFLNRNRDPSEFLERPRFAAIHPWFERIAGVSFCVRDFRVEPPFEEVVFNNGESCLEDENEESSCIHSFIAVP